MGRWTQSQRSFSKIQQGGFVSIENLKKILESELEENAKQYYAKYICSDIPSFKDGHEAATNRLLPLIQKAVEMAEFYGDFETWNCGWDGKSLPEDKAREFLAEFTKMTDIKKEGL